jgi:glycosyltransferase involved in cell wall biosynthesis
MRILFLTQYFPPETGAPQNRISYFARYFAAAGHTVTVLTALPSYPEGKIFPEYRGVWRREEVFESMRIIWVWIYATKSKAFLLRLLNYFSFMFSSVLLGIGTIGKQDVIIVESPPIFLGLSGLIYKFAKKARLALNVSDLWPESAVAMGLVRNRWIIRATVAFEELLYRRSDLITGQTRGIVKNIQSRIPNKPVALITNGVDEAGSPQDAASLAEVKRALGWQGTLVVGYAGLHGLVYGLETLVETAQILSSYRDITFVLFGDGPEKEKLVALAEERKLPNIKFYPPQSRVQILDIIRCFDATVIPLRNLKLCLGTLPSKMFEAMGAGVPVVAAMLGEAQAVVNEAGAGICVPPEDAQAIADAILRLYSDPALRARMGESGRQYVKRHYNRAQIARNYEQILQKATELPSDDLTGFVDLQSAQSQPEYPRAD